MISSDTIHTCKPNQNTQRDWTTQILNLFGGRPNEIPESESQDYKTNNSCSASPEIGEIGTFQVSDITVTTILIVVPEFLSNTTVTGILFYNFKGNFVNHIGNFLIAA